MSEPDLEQARSCRQAELLVQAGTVLTPDGPGRIDVACADGRVVALGDLHGSWCAETTLDATGLHVLPGVIDSQVHFREPGLTHKEDLETGTRGRRLPQLLLSNRRAENAPHRLCRNGKNLRSRSGVRKCAEPYGVVKRAAYV